MRSRATLLGARRWNRNIEIPPVAKPIRIGIAGLGARSRFNAIPKILDYDEYRLAAVCDTRSDLVDVTVSELSKNNNLTISGYTDFYQMIEKEQMDAVAILIDADKQIPLACAAMEKGLHVMAEVPLCYSMEHCWQIVTTTERTGKIFFLMEQCRYAGYVQAYRSIVQSGVIGKVVFAEGEYFHYIPGRFFQDDSGRWYMPEEFGTNPNVKVTWRYVQPVIGYLPHDLSPLLHILEDRVVRVVGMANQKHSYKHPNMEYSDTQAALMHTEKDVVLRLATGFSSESIDRLGGSWGHWQHIKGAEGVIEGPRTSKENHKLFIPAWQMNDPIDMKWGLPRLDAPPEAAGSGHGDLDYYIFAVFADAVLHGIKPEFDVYKAVETAAPAILAAQSIENRNIPIDVPDFRPGAKRKAGEMPK